MSSAEIRTQENSRDALDEALDVIARHRAANPVKSDDLKKTRRVQKLPKHRLGKPLKFTRPPTQFTESCDEEADASLELD